MVTQTASENFADFILDRIVSCSEAMIALLLLICGFIVETRSVSAAECDDCQAQRATYIRSQGDLQTHETLLQRNKDFLQRLDPSESSKSIKVKSNIVILAVRIETIKNNLGVLQGEMQTKGCDRCPNN